MLFRTKDVYVDVIENKDLNEAAEIYNSNRNFLLSHIHKKEVDGQWVLHELEAMKEVGFYSCKVVDISSEKIIGVMDFKIDKETYLSLLIIHSEFKGKGLGKSILQAFEKYVKSLNGNYIRIDVVTNYDSSVLDFWIKNGFVKFKDVELNWAEKSLPAVIMKKNLV